MASVDDRVVSMQFDNKSFSTAVTATMSLLDKLKASLSFSGTKNGLDDVQTSANKFSLGNVTGAIDGATQKFSALSVIGVTALATIANKAVDAGLSLVKSLTIAPLSMGFSQYQQQINATQTILANTSSQGENLTSVSAALDKLNTYANETIYNFSDMATNLGTFTSAGVKLGPATQAIEGLSNVAAAAGAGTQQTAGAMYQLSQALGRGKVEAQDWNSVVAAGMASSNFKTALLQTAKAMGTIKMPPTETIDQWIAAGNSFQSAMSAGQITSGVLTQTLGVMTGNMTDAQLAAEGYTAAQIISMQAMALQAKESAVNVKTATALMQNLSSNVASSWAAVYKTIVGDLPQATTLFTGLSNVMNKIFVDPINNFNTLLQQAALLGARTDVLNGFINIFKSLGAILKPIGDAFREIFPAKTAADIAGYAKIFETFTERLKVSGKTADEIKRTFAGFFAIFDLGKQVIDGVFFVIGRLLGQLGSGSGGVLKFSASIGDILVAFDKMVTNGAYIQKFFSSVSQDITRVVLLFGAARDAISGLFDKFDKKKSDDLSTSLSTVQSVLSPMANALQAAGTAVGNFLKPLSEELKPALDAAVNLFSQLGNNIATALQNQDFTGINKILQTGLLAGIFLLVKNFLGKGLTFGAGNGLVNSIQKSFDGLTGTLKTMQLQLKAKILEEIAVAIALLTASVVALSFINANKLQSSLSAMAVGFGELLGAMAVLTKLSGTSGTLKLPVIAASLVILAGAILVLTASIAILGNLKTDTLEKGLGAVALLLGVLTGAALLLSKNSGGLAAAGIGIAAIAVAMVILAGAVVLFGNMDLETLGKGLGSIAAALLIIGLSMRVFPNGAMMILQAAGLVILSVALEAIAGVVTTFALLDYESLGKGLGSIAAALLIIGLALKVMPNGVSLALQGVGLVLIAVALEAITGVVATLSRMDYGSLVKGIGSLAVILGVLAIAMKVMQSSILGAISLNLVVLALSNLIPVIQILAGMKWSDIAKGIGVMAIALAVLIAAGYLAEGAALGLAALALAALGLGAGIALAGIGIGAIAKGLGELVKLGASGIAILDLALATIIEKIPAFATALAVGFINILKVIGQNGPAIIQAFGTIIGSFLTAITDNIPKLAALIETLVQAIVNILLKDVPILLAAAITLIEAIITGIGSQIGNVVAAIATLIINLLDALASHIPDIIAAGANLVIQLLNGIAQQIPNIVGAVANIITTFITSIANAEGQIITAGANAIISLITGLGQNADRIVTAGANALINFINGLAQNSTKVVDAAGQAILDFLDGLDQAINKYEPQIIAEAEKIGVDIVSGVVSGLSGLVGSVTDKLKSGISGALGKVKDAIPGLGGPAHMLGQPIMDEISKGISNNTKTVTNALTDNVSQALKAAGKSIGQSGIDLDVNMTPTITPVLDLSNVVKSASTIPGILAATPIVAQTSFTAASGISATQQQQAADSVDATPSSGTTIEKVEFNQTNTSPVALTTLEIYRQSKNLLGQAKTALGVPS